MEGWLTIFLSDNNKFLLPGVEVRVRLYRAPDQFVMIHDKASKNSQGDFSLQIVSASLLVHKLELKNETYLTIERMLSKKQHIMIFVRRYRSLF